MDLYSVLRISPLANTHEIKKAYRALAIKYHPDKNKGDPTKFYEIHKIRDKNLIQLFQYHFYNVYEKDSKARTLFWNKIEEELNTNEESWKFQKNFAKKCIKYIKI